MGTNRNGDHFTPEELRDAAKTAVGRKIDLSHSQEFRDIVGGIVEAKFVEDGDNSRVECVGELFTDESEPARLAYKLMKRSIVGHVSMECDYQEGECSVCGRKVKSKADYCTHLKNYKGRKYQGKPVYEILHGITFTGMGLLDREGADDKAEIRQVADHQTNHRGGRPMDDETKRKTQGPDEPVDPSELSDADKDKLIRTQQGEIERLGKELDSLRKKLDDSEASHKAIVRKAQAETLLKQCEEAGRSFESDAAKTAEMDRLAGVDGGCARHHPFRPAGQGGELVDNVTGLMGDLRDLLPFSDAKAGPLSQLTASGSALVTTFSEGIGAVADVPIKALSGLLEGVRDLLPFSDAKRGPLSELTTSGASVMPTFTRGIEQTADLPARAVSNGLSNVSLESPRIPPVQVEGTGQAAAPAPASETSSASKASVVFERGAFQITVNGADGLDDLEGQLTEIFSRASLRLGEEWTNRMNWVFQMGWPENEQA